MGNLSRAFRVSKSRAKRERIDRYRITLSRKCLTLLSNFAGLPPVFPELKSNFPNTINYTRAHNRQWRDLIRKDVRKHEAQSWMTLTNNDDNENFLLDYL